MELETEKNFQQEVKSHEHKRDDAILSQNGMIKNEENVTPIWKGKVNNEVIHFRNNEESQKNHESLHTDKEVSTIHYGRNKDKHLQQMKIVYPQNYEEKGYIESIEQIQRVLDHKVLNRIKFIQLILRDFSPYVFSHNAKKQKEKKEVDPFDDEVSFTSQGQIIEKIQANAPKKQNSSEQVLIDKNFFSTQWMEQHWDNQLLRNLIIHNSIFHCRIIYILYILTSRKLSSYNIQFSQELHEIKQKIFYNQLRYSFDENIWKQQRQQQSYKYHKSKKQDCDQLPFVLEALQENKNFRLIDEFYTKLGFRNKNHPFNKKMVILNQLSYRLRYIKEFSFFSFSSVEQVLEYLNQQHSERFMNIAFYCNKHKASSRRVKLSQIHDGLCKDYEWLQSCHNYIQWLFPNHFKSYFNENSFPLGYVEAQIFKIDPLLRKKLLRSFQIYIDFMGCSIKEKSKPSSTFLAKSQNQVKQKAIIIDPNNSREQHQRLKDCLIYYTHNHLRIMRIIACLSVTGLRKYAEAFLNLLNRLNRNNDFSSLRNPLQKKWNVYSSSPQNKQRALQMCFIPYQNFAYLEINDDQIKKEKTNFLENNHGKKRVKMHSCEK